MMPRTFALPALQAVLRAQFSAALKGNPTAQRAVIEMVRQIEGEVAALEAQEKAATPRTYSDLDLARWIAAKLQVVRARQKEESKKNEGTSSEE